MLLAMADYNLSENGVQNYPEAQSAYEAARRALFRTDLDYDALAEALRAAMQKYDDEVLHGTKIPLQLTFGTLEGAGLNGWRFSVTDAYGAQSEFTSFPIALLPGDYAFTLTASDGANSARGSMCVASDGTVTAGGEALTEICVSGGQWLTAPILRSGSSLEAGVYTAAQTGSFEASYLVPDNRSGSVYFYVKPGSGLSAGSAYSTDTVQLYVCYERNGSRTENLKPWLSVNAVAAQLLQAGSAAVSATAEARYAMPGYTVVQSFAMLLERTPTLRALDVRCGGVAQSIGFDPDVNAYTCSVTADSVELTAQPFSEAAALRINGTAVAAGESFRLAVPSSGARAEITLSLSGKTQTYVVDFTSVASCPVTIRHTAGTQIAVYNAAGAQIGPSEETATSATFPLIPNERCTYVATINEFFHTSEAFTAASGLTLTAQEPETDSWLTSTQIRSGGNASRSDAFFAAKDFQSSTHEYGVRVIDTQSNLYLWGKEDGYSITEPESGTEIAAGLKENGVNLAGFLTPGSEGRTLTLRVTKNADPRFYQDYLFHISRALTLRDRDGIQAKLDGTDAALFQLENGKLTGTPKNGIIEEDGVLHYYVNGKLTYAGLIKIGDDYYYVNSKCEVVRDCDYYISWTHDLLPQGKYHFDADGKLTGSVAPLKNGIYEEDGSLYFYRNGERAYAGLIQIDGDYYYVRSTCEVVHDRSYYVYWTHGLMPEGYYNFDSAGRMILDSETE